MCILLLHAHLYASVIWESDHRYTSSGCPKSTHQEETPSRVTCQRAPTTVAHASSCKRRSSSSSGPLAVKGTAPTTAGAVQPCGRRHVAFRPKAGAFWGARTAAGESSWGIPSAATSMFAKASDVPTNSQVWRLLHSCQGANPVLPDWFAAD